MAVEIDFNIQNNFLGYKSVYIGLCELKIDPSIQSKESYKL